jgi:predicted HAD superfamily Cof-like phosphohydrolase
MTVETKLPKCRIGQDHFNMVGDFHKKFGLPSYVTLAPDIFLFRMDLISEEMGEILRAFRKKDAVGFADGLGDLAYVIYGFLHTAKLDLQTDLVFWAWRRNKRGPFPEVTFDPVAMSDFLKVYHRNMVDIFACRGMPGKGYNLSFDKTLRALYDLAYASQVPMVEVFAEIQRANMSKERSTGDGDARSTRSSGFDVVKPAGFIPPRIEGVLHGSL